MERTKYDPSDVIAELIFYALLLIVLQMAFGVFGTDPVRDLIEGVIAYLPKVIAAMLTIVVTAAIAAAVKDLIDAGMGGLSYGRALAVGVSVAILVVGVFAALDQLQIAEDTANGLFHALLAIVAGSATIAIGGGGTGPMRQRWERALQRLDSELPDVRSESPGAEDRIAERAQQRAQQVQSPTGNSSTGSRSHS